MKIAIVGKGGSGKSTVSWLLANYLADKKNNYVLAVDADHNMDLTSNLGVEYDSKTPTLHHNHDLFRQLSNLDKPDNWSSIILKNKKLPEFSLVKKDNFTNQISIPVKTNLDLAIVGLGDNDMLYSDKCSHGHSAPLKYYLSLLKTNENQHLIVDSVAGSDMVNYGLYVGCDLVICVVEGHKNSIKVANQLKDVCNRIRTPLGFIINKPNDLEILNQFVEDNKNLILGHLGYDKAINEYNFKEISSVTVNQSDFIWNNILSKDDKNRDKIKELYDFEAKRSGMIK